MRHVALLRGINVGGKHRLPMGALRELVAAAGGERVETYIQSGNVAFDAPARAAKALGPTLALAIEEQFGFAAPVVVRSARQLRAAVSADPFPSCERGTVHLGFFSARPEARAVAGLDGERSPGDSFAVVGSEVFLHLPGGAARTKLTNAWFDRELGVVTTVRNWKTVEALLDLTGA